MNPDLTVKKILKEIHRLEGIARKHSDQTPGKKIDYRFTYECKPQECFKRPDGMWQARDIDHNNYTNVFLWRLGSKYCCQGRPCYTSDTLQKMYADSEHEKLIHEEDGLKFYWMWEGWVMPTENCWGVNMTKPFIQIRKGKFVALTCTIDEKGAREDLLRFLRSYKVGMGWRTMSEVITIARRNYESEKEAKRMGKFYQDTSKVKVAGIISDIETVYQGKIKSLADSIRTQFVIPFCKKHRMAFQVNMGLFWFERKTRKGVRVVYDSPEEERRYSIPRFNFNSKTWGDYCNVWEVLSLQINDGPIGERINDYPRWLHDKS